MSTTKIPAAVPARPRRRAAAAEHGRRWAALPVVLAGTSMVVLDFFIVNVAMPSMQGDLHASAGAIEWVVAGYGADFGGVPDHRRTPRRSARPPARCSPRAWRCSRSPRRPAGVAPSAGDAGRGAVAQGAAAALLMPQVLAILGVAYEGADRVQGAQRLRR